MARKYESDDSMAGPSYDWNVPEDHFDKEKKQQAHAHVSTSEPAAQDDDRSEKTESRFVKQEQVGDLVKFNSDTKNYLKEMSDFAFHHQSIPYHINCFIADEVQTDADSYYPADREQLKKDLTYLAFTEDVSEEAVRSISESILRSQNAAYWASNFLSNVLYADNTSLYAHKETCLDVLWKGSNDIQFMNANKKQPSSAEFWDVSGGYKYFYHGTDWDSIDDIIKNGIVLNGSDFGQDFSFRHRPGFYVADRYERAKEWADSKAACPGVIVFKVKKDIFQDGTIHKDLTRDPTKDGVYRFYRSSGEEEAHFRGDSARWKTIKGPMLLNPGDRDNPQYSRDTQVCIADTDIAAKFQAAITNVVFYPNRNYKKPERAVDN